MDLATPITQTAEKIQQEYRGGDDMPLLSFAVLSSIYLGAVGGLLWRARCKGRLPRRVRWDDIVLLGVASHKLSHILTRAKVTAFVRAPFTRFQKSSGQGTVSDTARGEGLQKAIGQLLTCPYCAGAWTSAGLTVGLIFNPPVTRWICGLLSVNTVTDLIHMGYFELKQKST